MEIKQLPDIKVIYGTAAEAVLAGFVTVEKAADDIVRMYELDASATEKVRSKITGRCDEIRRTPGRAVDEQSVEVNGETGASTADVIVAGGGEASGIAGDLVHQDGDGAGQQEDPAPHLRQALLDALSFEGILGRDSTFADVEVDICSAGPLAERVRVRSLATDSCHATLSLADVVLSAYDSRTLDIDTWNKWTPRRRAAVVAAELELLTKAAEAASQTGMATGTLGAAQGANPGTAALGVGLDATVGHDDGSNSAGGQVNTQGE